MQDKKNLRATKEVKIEPNILKCNSHKLGLISSVWKALQIAYSHFVLT